MEHRNSRFGYGDINDKLSVGLTVSTNMCIILKGEKQDTPFSCLIFCFKFLFLFTISNLAEFITRIKFSKEALKNLAVAFFYAQST